MQICLRDNRILGKNMNIKIFRYVVTFLVLWRSAVDGTPCNDYLPCTKSDGRTGMCLKGQCRTAILSLPRNNLNFIIRVKYPEHKIQGTKKQLLIRGNGLGLNWTDGFVMNKTNKDTWETNIKYQSTIEGFSCQDCADNTIIKNKFQYRIFTANGDNMKGGNFAVDLPVSMSSSYFTSPPVIEVYPWFYSSSGQSNNFTLNSTEIGKTRTLYYYLPPSYEENTFKRYPNILAFDIYPGQQFATIIGNGLDGLLSSSGTIQEVVVIGYGDYQPSIERYTLLTPTPGNVLFCQNGSFENMCDGCLPNNTSKLTSEEFERLMKNKCGKIVQLPGKGMKFFDFYIKEARPKVQELTQSRLLLDQPNSGLMGYSLGGLMSCHGAWTLSDVFGFAACQSPSLWWPRVNGSGRCSFDFMNITMEDHIYTSEYSRKILIDAGSEEEAECFHLTHSVVEAGLKMVKRHQFVMNKNLWVAIYPGSHHTLEQWSVRIWTALQTLLPSQGDPKMPKNEGRRESVEHPVGITTPFV